MEGSGIAQLVSTNYKDSVLTKKPQITFFRNPAKQHTPYAIDTVEETFNEIPNFSDEVFCRLSKSGDLIDSITAKFVLSSVHISNTIDSLYLSNYTDTTITFDENTLTLSQMITEYDSLIIKYKSFLKSSMIYWRGFRKLLINSNTNYDSIIALATTYNTNQDDVLDSYQANNEFSAVNVLKNTTKSVIKFNFDILSHISTAYTTDITSIYNTALTKSYKSKVLKYLTEYTFFQKTYMQKLIDNKSKFVDMQKSINNTFYRFSWVDNIAIALINSITMEVGGVRFDHHTRDTIECYYQNNIREEHRNTYSKMLGNVKMLTTFDSMKKPIYELYVEIPFGHLIYESMSVPIVAMKHQDVVIRLQLSSLDECCFFEPDYLSNYNTEINLEEHVSILDACLLVNYVQLGNNERRKFSTKTVESLIEQTRLLSFKNIVKKDSMMVLELANVVKDITWTVQSKYATQVMKLWNQYKFQYTGFAKTSVICYEEPFVGKLIIQLHDANFSTNIDPLIFGNGYCEIYHSKFYNGKYKILNAQNNSMVIDLDQFIYPDTFAIKLHPNIQHMKPSVESEHIIIYGQTLDTPRDPSFYVNVNSMKRKHHSEIHKRPIALIVDQLQPSGVLNFNRIKNKHLRIQFENDVINYLSANGDTIIVNIIGKSYNTSVSDKGYLTLAYGY
jgi:hypothetical protein